MKIQNVKGGYDYLPEEQRIKNYIKEILKTTFETYGYNPIETPILCYYDILADKYDAENDILKEIYKLNDQGNRMLGLRYDLTVPFAKFIALNKNKIALPFKRYEMAKVFRDGPVKLGRDREFTQCDVDVVGLPGQMIEAELLTIYKTAFQKLDIPIIIKFNSRNLMTGLILECGVNDESVPEVTTIIDKIGKISSSEFASSLYTLGLNDEQINFLSECFNLSLDELNTKFKNTENAKIKLGLNELNELTNYLKKLNMADICEFTPSLARGQNYYTGNVFEVYDAEKRILSSIGGGGRFDTMITNFIDDGTLYPAVGISFGLSSIYAILKDRQIFASSIDIYIIPMKTDIESLVLANNLRNLGYKVEIEMTNKKLKRSLNYANRLNIPYVIIFGEDEIASNKIVLKSMLSDKVIELSLNDLEKIKQFI